MKKLLIYDLMLLLFSTTVFLAGLLLGIELGKEFNYQSGLEDMVGRDQLYKGCLFFLYNNLLSIMYLLLGIFSMGTITVFNLFINGLELGYSIDRALALGFSLNEVAMLLMPHGSLEVLGLILAGSAGIRIPVSIVLYLIRKRTQPISVNDLNFIYKTSLLSVILVFIAACIESSITSVIAEDYKTACWLIRAIVT